jgi:hypothetical protein
MQRLECNTQSFYMILFYYAKDSYIYNKITLSYLEKEKKIR